ncbi:hypothetical protein [Caldithrix abyssi]|uniref:Phosphate-selective porin O and P n=1 Tax=Caldithrix abyssi DSM 13497 TaxID=880073 RepID=H1XVR8_CALAY|nr:hypothetical protein [Caldithrix abyssi]APF20894.1 hypothetical protein Cabys_4149 [Caldithrix abyssi DSM 13497]EHO40645.1 hypothetical protein Calab_1011 [Caldithrix abyssi DSM 13497]
MNSIKKIFLIVLAAGMLQSAFGQVSPEIQLGARGVMSFNTDITGNQKTTSVNDFSDTGLLLGFRQKMYNRFRGQLVIGLQFPDADSDLGQVFFHQTFLLLEDQKNVLKMGRSRVRSALIEFPTLRDDDALAFTDVLNPFSSGENTEDNQYGNVIELAHIFAQRYWLTVHGEHFTRTPVPPATSETDFSLNALGFSFVYMVPETQIWNRPFIQQLGIGFNNFLTDRQGYSNQFDQTLKNILVSGVFNLKPDPIYFVDARFQVVYNLGFKEIKTIGNFYDLTRARAAAHFFSLRFLYRKLERPTLQLALSGGFKVFPDLTQKARQWQVIFNAFYRLGENFDLAFQVQQAQFTGDLKTLYGKSETRFQVGLVYSIDQRWNKQFDDRNSLLNLEHGYIP